MRDTNSLHDGPGMNEADMAVVLDELADKGWVISDTLFPQALVPDLLAAAQQDFALGLFHHAGVGRQAGFTQQEKLRGDNIRWLERRHPAPVVAEFWDWSDMLRTQINRAFFTGLRHQEMHFARYEQGQRYVRHIDQHQGTRHRSITLVLYLNAGWQESDGGQLCVYDPADHECELARVSPVAGRVALFRSDVVPHAVLPAVRSRWSVTGWFRTDEDPVAG